MLRHRTWLRAAAVAALLVLSAGGTAQGSASSAATPPSDVGTTAASAGCGKAPTLTSGNHTIQSSGQNRGYILRVPANYDMNHPYRLVFGFHWLGGTANDVDSGGTDGYNWSYYGLRRLADSANNGTIFVAPQGINNGWANSGNQDLTFVDDMLRQIQAGLCVDTTQIFAGGFSYGGGMSYALACARANVFRAVAVYSGATLSGCTGGTQPIAYIGIHGITDNVLPISAGRGLRDTFVRNNGCTAQNPREPAQGSLTHVVTAYSGCRAGYPVVWAAFDGGHTPGPVDGCNCQGWRTWTSGEVWKFFTQFDSSNPPQTPGPVEVGVNYRLVVQHSGKAVDISGASTAAGALLQQWSATGGLNQQFDFLDSGGGYYRIRARHSGLVLQVASSSSGADITQQPDTNATSQQWQVLDQGSGVVSLVNRQSGLAMDVWNLSTADGGRISQWSYSGAANQRFQLQRTQ
ncbi:RICIN domain-containing protein [Goodfellowiella coeruleoviolacea]|uniref:Poly(3-hydroxybutyrate) depolymerase n=1 Tax=Goodfellowiella coeruleoviolacea TaxID=334858 RepID=A0AAE3GN54_9PSEU|nr:RICIN domain-containing protein [Goodfellowiella coeruleoviolacea]MCP2170474.1 Poly(3-hydroxybutyrate) depolymerase [Goodfellowiella coeruleoviolacea]